MRALCLTAFILASVGSAHAAPVDPLIGKVEVTLDLPKDKPYVGEMIMLRMRSFIRANVVLDEVEQPPMIDFDVQQLGRDKPIQAMVNGFNVDGIERDLAIFPDQAGRLIIPPFVRRVTIVNAENERVETSFASKPVYVDVQTYGAVNPADAWWLPAKSLTMTDSWAPEPDEIAPGTLTRRTIVIEAAGLNADRLPPAPDIRAPGIIAFRGPVQRETILGEDGPVARATYSWDLRPATGAPARMPAVTIPWFDTGERHMRDAGIPERWVAYIGTFVHTRNETMRSFRDQILSPGPLGAGLVGFAWTGALLAFVLTRRGQAPRSAARPLAKLRRAGRFADEPAFRVALVALSRTDPTIWGIVSKDSRVAPSLAAFDAARYGREQGPPPPLKDLAIDIERLWREVDDGTGSFDDRHLPALDAAVAEPNRRRSLWQSVIASAATQSRG